MIAAPNAPTLVGADDLPDYPFGPEDRLDSHFFIPWHRQRWLKSEMRLRATPECRGLYFDLICESYDHTPIGTLPNDLDTLARILMVDASHFRALCRLPFGPLYKWQPCRCGDEVRLYHATVVRSLTDGMARREDNRARNEAANAAKRMQRLRGVLAGYHAELAKNDAAVRWVDQWLVDQGVQYRRPREIERAMAAWSDHMLTMGLNRRR